MPHANLLRRIIRLIAQLPANECRQSMEYCGTLSIFSDQLLANSIHFFMRVSI